MKKIILSILFITSTQCLSYDGAYECGVIQKNDFNNMALKVLNADSYFTKAREMESLGDQDTLIKQLNEADKLLTSFKLKSSNKKFCYSFKKQFAYLKLKAAKLKLQVKVFKSKFKNSNSCDYSISKIKSNLENYRGLASVPHKKYMLISKSLNKTNVLANSKECTSKQKLELFGLFDIQNEKLESLYKQIKLSRKD